MNRPLLVLWALAGVGLGTTVYFGSVLFAGLPTQRTAEEYVSVDWAWVLELDGIIIPATGTLLVASVLAIVVFYAVQWRAPSIVRSGGDPDEQ